MIIEEWKGAELLLNGYSTRGKTIYKSYGGREYEIERYQGEHANEYCVYEVKDGVRDGTAELFDDGMVKMRWTMKQGVRDGSYVLFDKGVAVREGKWSDVGGDMETVFENRRSQLTMVLRSNGVKVYEGGFNDKLERDGLGYEYENGELIRFGEWKNDRFVCLKQRFVNEKEMIEYAEGSTMDILSRKPIYVGGYQLDEVSGLMKRNGWGRVLNRQTGVCRYENEWKMGKEINGSRLVLNDGWYSYHASGKATRVVVEKETQHTVIPPILLAFPQEVVDLTIAAFQFNSNNFTAFRLSNLPLLKTITIGDTCFKETRFFSLSNLPSLERVKTGEKCFTISSDYDSITETTRNDGLCEICCCQNLQSIQFGDYSFGDCCSMVLQDLPSLCSIKIGVCGFYYASLFSLSSSRESVL